MQKQGKEQIQKGELKRGKLVKTIHILQYYHTMYAFKLLYKARALSSIITYVDEIDGLEHRSDNGILPIKILINVANTSREKAFPQPVPKTKKAIPMVHTSKICVNRLRSTILPTIKIMFTKADQLTSSKMIEL